MPHGVAACVTWCNRRGFQTLLDFKRVLNDQVPMRRDEDSKVHYFRPPNCPYCRNHPLMSRKGFYKRGPPEPLYGLVPITSDGEIIEGGPPTPLRVFQCNSCAVLALFPENQERHAGLKDRTDGLGDSRTVSPAEQILREQLRLRRQQEATDSQAERIVRENQRLDQHARLK
jgi:hypothetical protein